MTRSPMVFVVGLGRSGTTLLRLMLDSHPQIAIPYEQGWLPRAVRAEGRGKPRKAFLRAVIEHQGFADAGLDPDALRKEIDSLENFTIADGVRCFYRMYAQLHGKTRYGDKTPPYHRRIPMIANLLPEARFVHIIRDGRDVALSRMDKWFEPEKTIEGLARKWVDSVGVARRDGLSIAGRYTEVRYEDLIRAPERELGRICSLIEAPFDNAMLTYHERAASRLEEMKDRPADSRIREDLPAERRRAVLWQTTKPPDESNLERWRVELDSRENQDFVKIAGPLLQVLGYPTS